MLKHEWRCKHRKVNTLESSRFIMKLKTETSLEFDSVLEFRSGIRNTNKVKLASDCRVEILSCFFIYPVNALYSYDKSVLTIGHRTDVQLKKACLGQFKN